MRPRLLLTYLKSSSFVRDDITLLGERYDVRCFPFDTSEAEGILGQAETTARLVRAQWAWLKHEVREAEIILSWFADYHAVLPVWIGRKRRVPVGVVLGGFDCNWLPELSYGVYESRWRAPLARYVLNHADLLLPVSEALIESENRFATWPEPRRQGVRAHVPEFSTPYAVIPTGYDPEAWPLGRIERGLTVCTVGLFTSDRTLRLKGIDLLVEAARLMPEVAFTVVGVPEARQVAVRAQLGLPANVRLLAPQPREWLAEVYGDASVYVQLSRSEGLPNVLCEAMLCGCIPVGSRVSGIPDAVGEAGELVDEPNPVRIAEAIRAALARAPEGRQAARDHILAHFTREHRRLRLFNLLDALRKKRPVR